MIPLTFKVIFKTKFLVWDEDAISIVGDDYIGRVKYPLKDFTKKQTLTVKFPEIKKLEPKVEMDFEITKIPK